MSYHSTSSRYDRNNDDAASLKSEQLGKMPKANHFLLPALFLEIAILACLAIFAYYLRFTDVFAFYHRYFNCDDPDLNYPAADKIQDQVTIYVNDLDLYCITALLPPLIFILGEIFYKFCGPSSKKVISTLLDKFKVPLFIRRMLRFIGTFWLGLLITSILTDSIKLLSGSPRPYLKNALGYDTYVNTNPPGVEKGVWCVAIPSVSTDFRQALLSFPSFYATISAYAATFAICYLNVVLDIHGNYFLRPIIAATLAGMALMAGYTRWMLYYNSWEDILIGYILGFGIALYFSYAILNGFKEHQVQELTTSGYGGDVANPNASEARPGFFRFLPRIRPNLTVPRARVQNYDGSVFENNHADPNAHQSSMGYASNAPNMEFQRDLHNTVENYGSSQPYGQ